ncbi:MAG TPA: RIP metalloprotease RseP [Spirochaetota bacterium]|nr:RIP metalloprotease RseP [Spirochaetota bacterium]HPH01422.1 RIP metalloprotease RseP [Spirochaetota bacterium]HPN82667.1 RIP metalloprotease RseP [Spirochaetota bacterium]
MDTVLSIVYGLITLGILVFVHELGHFLAGKAVGIRVTAFSIGFGRGIVSFERGGTLYKIGWIPIGGYCRFAGEGEDLGDDKKGEPDEFYERPAWARLITVSAGVVFNFVLAILIFIVLGLTGYSYTSPDNRITVIDQTIDPKAGVWPAATAGLRTGDKIRSVDGIATPDFRKLQEEIAVRPDRTIRLEILRSTNAGQIAVDSIIKDTGMGYIGILPYYGTTVSGVESGTPAKKLGLLPGDRILAWNSLPVQSLHELKARIAETGAREVEIRWERKGKILQGRASAIQRDGAWVLGFTPTPPVLQEYSLDGLSIGESLAGAFSLFGQNIGRIVDGIALLFRKEVDAGKAVAGPLRIVHFSGQVMKESTTAGYLMFLAMISIALGFFNLLPIPAADGGHVVLTLIEMIRRKRFSFAVLRRIQMTGIIILMSLFIFVMFFDIMNIIR